MIACRPSIFCSSESTRDMCRLAYDSTLAQVAFMPVIRDRRVNQKT